MKDDGEEFNDFVDDNLFFVEDLSIEDGDDLSDIVNRDAPELEKITYVFLHRLFAVFRPTGGWHYEETPRRIDRADGLRCQEGRRWCTSGEHA